MFKPETRSFLLLTLAVMLICHRAAAQVFGSLHYFAGVNQVFTNSDGASPAGSLLLAGNKLYGATGSGGVNGSGTIFSMNMDGSSLVVLHRFALLSNGTNSDGANPNGSLILSGNMLYGTAQNGGVYGNGAVFVISTNGTGFTNLYSFTGGNDGANPSEGLALSGNRLYGTANGGGAFDAGAVFALSTNGMSFTNFYSFTGSNDGASPNGALVLSGGMLYGTANQGGTNGSGVIFAVNTNGAGFTNLYNFTDGNDGGQPLAGLILVGSMLYGTGSGGGADGAGTVFAISTNGLNFQPLYSFTGGADGGQPRSTLLFSGAELYGTAPAGGAFFQGTVYGVSTNNGGFTKFYTFTGGNDGASPNAALILSGGTLYGMTPGGGTNDNGVVFAINTGTMAFSNLYDFSASASLDVTVDGASPNGGVALSGDTLYGTAQNGGSDDAGMVFAVNMDGSGYTNLYSFTGGGDGGAPEDHLTLSGSTLYGAASENGTNDNGNLFAINTNGAFTVLYTFAGGETNEDGVGPNGGLLLSGSKLYGTTSGGGTNGDGTLFAVSTNGAGFTNLYNFDGPPPQPNGGLLLLNGTLFGTTAFGGTNSEGSIFSVSTNGSGFTNLYSFSGGGDGAAPAGNLVFAGGALYGVASQGGTNSAGTIFKVSTNGTGFTVLHTFNLIENDPLTGENTNADGGEPNGGLTLSGGTLYGAAAQGGLIGLGCVFAINTDGSGFTNLYSLTLNDASAPQGGFFFVGNTFYGTASLAGPGGYGSAFAFTLGTMPLGVSVSSTNMIFTWYNPGFVLMSASALTGPWTPVPGGASPCSVPETAPQQFFRLEGTVNP